MRVLIADGADSDLSPGTVIDDAAISELYADDSDLLRLNFVSSLDGAATGRDGRSGSINSPADHRGFAAMRAAADVLLVGAGTARAEDYGPAQTPIVVVSRGAQLPERLADEPGVVLATTQASGAVEDARTWLCGRAQVDLAQVVRRARAAWGPHVLCEGGPSLAADLVAAGLVDELALSWTPHLVGGHRVDHPRILDGAAGATEMTCRHLLEEDGTLLGLWRVSARSR